jgi:undecaprenyl-diphosphatase
MNDLIQDWINDQAGKFGLLDAAMKFSAVDIVYLAAPLLLLLWFWPAGGARERAFNQRLAVVTFFAVLAAVALAAVVAHFVFEARPFVTDGSTHQLINHTADNGFPSDHATFAFAAAGALLVWRRGPGLLCLAAASLIAVSRVYVGVHWPSDVLAGGVVGLGAGYAVGRCLPLLETPQRLLSRFLPSPLIAAP